MSLKVAGDMMLPGLGLSAADARLSSEFWFAGVVGFGAGCFLG